MLAGLRGDLPPSHQSVVDHIVGQVKQLPAGQKLPVIQLLGVDTATKQLVALASQPSSVCAPTGCPRSCCRFRAPSWRPSLDCGSARACCCPLPCISTPARARVRGPKRRKSRPSTACWAVSAASSSSTRARSGCCRGNPSCWSTSPSRPPPSSGRPGPPALGEQAGDSPGLLAGQFSLNLASHPADRSQGPRGASE